MLNKQELRTKMIEMRGNLPLYQKESMDREIFSKVINSTEYINSKVIFIYVSCKGEVDTHRIINHAIANSKTVCVPKVISLKEGMIPIAISSIEEMEANKMGILEPVSTAKQVNINEIDMVIIPGLAFDNIGGRLGYGGGFYDRFLPFVREGVPQIGIAYDFQVINKIPSESHDFKVFQLITN